MLNIIRNWVITALVIWGVSYLLPTMVHVDDFMVAMKVALVLGLVNLLIKPVLLFFAFPITVVTLGLFVFVINALMVMLVAHWVDGFAVYGFVSALVFSVILSFVNDLFRRSGHPRRSSVLHENSRFKD